MNIVEVEILVDYIALIPIISAVIVLLYQYRKKNHQVLLFMAMAWLFLAVWAFTEAFAMHVNSAQIFRYRGFLLVGMGYFVIFTVDYITREKFDPIKLSIFSAMASLTLYLMFQPAAVDDIQYHGTESFAYGGDFRVLIFFVGFFPGLLLLLFFYKLHRNAPDNLKKYSRINLAGAATIGIISPLIFGTGLTLIVPGIIYISMGTGAFLMGLAFGLEPRLGFVLPFRAMQLMVLDGEAGIPIFTHSWQKVDVKLPSDPSTDADLVSGMLQGVSMFVKESIKRGDMREIHVERGILLIKRDDKHVLSYVLIATKASQTLRSALELFAADFVKNFRQQLQERNEVSLFQNASEIVESVFAFVPNYD